MEMRFEEVTDNVYDVLRNVRTEYFSELANANILPIFDTKKRVSKGKLVLASIRKVNELQRFLTINESGSLDGFDYILTIDKEAWNIAEDIDKVRIIRHELRHTEVDGSSDKPYKLRGHSIEDFYSEVELNKDDPRWAERLVASVTSIYDNEEE